ncbi:MAG: site-specific DNA-methyltransferase [Spirochaetaceae bacterium]|nr:site-specific DNA-methyltransferase [Spirochaetaceae bacterium]
MKNLNTIIQGDCIAELKNFPDDSIDLIFADPPYNMQLENALYRPNNTKVDGVSDEWDKFPSFVEYDEFCAAWLFECRRILKGTGSIWVSGTYHNIFRIGAVMLDLGFWILNDVIWHKTNPMPNFLGTRFTNATETLLWCSKGKNYKKYTFNYKMMKQYNAHKQMTSVWQIGLCIGAERLKKADGKKLHAAQKPEELLKRIILSTSAQGDLVLDPFFGTGTTGAVAKKLKRNFIGIEKDYKYIAFAKTRIDGIKDFLPEAEWLEEAKGKRVKVPFALLVKEHFIDEGETLYSLKRYNATAFVCADGQLRHGNRTGSIHKMGAFIQETLSCNGWKFWYIARGGGLIRLDDVRTEYLKGGSG